LSLESKIGFIDLNQFPKEGLQKEIMASPLSSIAQQKTIILREVYSKDKLLIKKLSTFQLIEMFLAYKSMIS
jgi:hypothetical protein